MRWQRRKPLWPLVAFLTVLLALAVDAPRNWQLPETAFNSALPEPIPEDRTKIASARSWYDTLYPSTDESLSPFNSPVVRPVLPKLEEPQIPAAFEDLELAQLPSSDRLPTRSEFNFGTLLQIRDSLQVLGNKLSENETDENSDNEDRSASAPPVKVSSPQDRLAMHRRPDRTLPVALPPQAIHQRRLEDFADVMMDAVQRKRLGLTHPVKIAMRSADPVRSRVSEPASQLPELAETDQSEPAESQIQSVVEQKPLPPVPATANPPVESHAEVRPTIETAPEPENAKPEPELAAVKETTPPQMPLLRFYPQALVDRLQSVAGDSPAAPWADETLSLVKQLAEATNTSTEQAPQIVQQLQQLVVQGQENAEQVVDHALRQHWLRLVQALDCRTDIWASLFDPQLRLLPAELQVPMPRDAEILPVLNEIVSSLEGNENGEAWRDYLLLDQIATASSEGVASDTRGRRQLAQEVLSRMADSRLTESQREFITRPPVAQLRETVLPWALGPVDIETLTAIVERYDTHHDVRYAAALAQIKQRLQWSPVEEYRDLAKHLDDHYRSANMRVALSNNLLSRMLPKQSSSMSAVNDKIAGAKVKGRSRTTVSLHTKMIPNNEAWQIALVAKGAVLSKTRSDTWPASVNNSARMFYEAQKTVFINSQGLRIARTRATARGRNELVGIDTNFDPIPILSHLVRDVARRKHHKSRGIAHRQVKAKVVRQAKSKMDRDADPKIHRLQQKFVDNVLGSMEKLALVAEPIDMYTTSDRAVMLARLANSFQLASNSLRPLAPSDSLASFQLHESALNNAIDGIGLNGQRMSALELHHFIATRLGKPGALAPDDLPVRAKIEFALHNAIRVNCQDDCLELVLNIREVSHGRDKIRNFSVHAYYRPKLDGLDVRLIRAGTLQFEGRNLRTGPRVVLHSVFGKLLRKDQEMSLMKEGLANDPRLKGLMVTQLVIDDGWIGLALGPEQNGRTAWRSLPHVVR